MRKPLVAAALVCATVARAQAPLTPKLLNGEWTGTLALDNSSPRIAAVFELTDSSFAGKVYTDGTLFGDMREGSISANKVHFKVDRLDFTGTVVGARMNVDLIVYNGSTRKLTLTKTPPTKPDTAIGIERVASLDERRPGVRSGSRGNSASQFEAELHWSREGHPAPLVRGTLSN